MTEPLPHALPYGLRDVKITPYTDNSATELGTETVDLPVSRTLSFSEAEEFNQLEGDDEIVATHGAGPQVEWELEAGGISLRAWAAISGGSYTPSSASSPRVMKKNTKDGRPYFKIEGQVISDSGGDIHCEIFRAKCNDTLEGEFAYGEFMVTSCSGVGYGSLYTVGTGDPNTSVEIGDLYRFIQNGTAQTISGNTIEAPTNLSSGAVSVDTVDLTWSTVAGAESYRVYQREVGETAWTQSTTTPTTPTTGTAQVTGLTADTDYEFVVRTVVGGVESGNSNIDNATTAVV